MSLNCRCLKNRSADLIIYTSYQLRLSPSRLSNISNLVLRVRVVGQVTNAWNGVQLVVVEQSLLSSRIPRKGPGPLVEPRVLNKLGPLVVGPVGLLPPVDEQADQGHGDGHADEGSLLPLLQFHGGHGPAGQRGLEGGAAGLLEEHGLGGQARF